MPDKAFTPHPAYSPPHSVNLNVRLRSSHVSPFRKPEVRLLKNTAAGVIFSVKSGKGFLRQCVIYDPHSHGLIHSLCWQDVPLIRFWSEAGCPTCAEFVYSGFAEDEQVEARFSFCSRKLELPVVWPRISLIPISAFYSTDTIRLLPPRWKGYCSKHWCSARQPILMMSNKPWYFLVGNVCTKQSCNTTYQNSPRAKHYRPAHGRVSALISTSAHPKPGQAPTPSG